MGSLTVSWCTTAHRRQRHTGGESKGTVSLAFISNWLTKLDLQEEYTS
jgi:hypothetical protein